MVSVLICIVLLSVELVIGSPTIFRRNNVSAEHIAKRALLVESQDFVFTGSYQTFTVPPGVSTISATLYGACGASVSTPEPGTGGTGAMISADIPVTSGEDLYIYVGGAGTTSAGGFNGGGTPCYTSGFPSGGGGGATDIRRFPFSLSDRLLVAGGGGGAYSQFLSSGGNGGYPSGIQGTISTSSYIPGYGGTDTQGGAAGSSCGMAGTIGAGASCCAGSGYGGGGGGGYYGGGSAYGTSAGGGSGYSITGTTTNYGVAASNGPGSATLQWNAITADPTSAPISTPTFPPTKAPTASPTQIPTCKPSANPTLTPTAAPTAVPTAIPTAKPTTVPTLTPSLPPTAQPTCAPTTKPTPNPTMSPSAQPTVSPTVAPTFTPTCSPTLTPTAQPTCAPTLVPTCAPTLSPTAKPTCTPTASPTATPTAPPTLVPTAAPTLVPTTKPTPVPTALPTSQPSSSPTRQPSARPTTQPSAQPTCRPSRQPTSQPSEQPTTHPTRQPSRQPTSSPSAQPTRDPSAQPSAQPSRRPSTQPSRQPSSAPSRQPTGQPSSHPTRQPTQQPTSQPSRNPSAQPSAQPSARPSAQPSRQPSSAPSTQPSRQPSSKPTRQPSEQPTAQPSNHPTRQPSAQPSGRPTSQPTNQPTKSPSSQPTMQPSAHPSRQPTVRPSSQPSSFPTSQPSRRPTAQPSSHPSRQPSSAPSGQPTRQPSSHPTNQPTEQPTSQPSHHPTCQPSVQPTTMPTRQPSRQPTSRPSSQPTKEPTAQPSVRPSCQPSGTPTRQPSSRPSTQPSSSPSAQPSAHPSTQPSGNPSAQPSSTPSAQPSATPSAQPSITPTKQPSTQPSASPSAQPSVVPSTQPTSAPSAQPSASPTTQPTTLPSTQPSSVPTSVPTVQPSTSPSAQPSAPPSCQPSSTPSAQPSTMPSAQPSATPSAQPTDQPTSVPSVQPSATPSAQPSTIPSSQPSSFPSGQPSSTPSSQPSSCPTSSPTALPTVQPSNRPSSSPTSVPSTQPTCQPSGDPTSQPTSSPSFAPTSQPSAVPTSVPSNQPSSRPSSQPSAAPSSEPSGQPTAAPSSRPTSVPSSLPTALPTAIPSSQPTTVPSPLPSSQPSATPTSSPTSIPSAAPTSTPSSLPTSSPTSRPSGQPTATPTSQPSRAPSSQPSVSPTVRPSAQPSGSPTTQPSARPSARPTSKPSAQPTSSPSSAPSSRPSLQPLSHPTSRPSGQPTGLPTRTPTAYKSSRFIYSKSPTRTPTQSPTLSELAQWTSKMQTSLSHVAANDSAAVVHRSTYYELDVLSNTPSSVYGGCSAWSTVVSGDIKVAQYTYKTSSLSISSLVDTDFRDHSTTLAASSAQCSDPVVSNAILSAMVGQLQLVSGVPASRSFPCGASTWVVRHCSVGSSASFAPAVCIGCADPCSAVSHCNTDPSAGTIAASSLLSVSPCMPQQCTGNTVGGAQYTGSTGLRVFSVSFTDVEKAPEILSAVTTASKTSIRVIVQLSSTGSLYCAVYRTSASVNAPTTVNSVLLQNIIASTNAANTSTAIIQGLDAASSYRVYFLTVSPIGVKSTIDQVLSSFRDVSTACCKTVTATLSTTSAIEQQAVSNILSVAMSAKPSSALDVRVQLYSVSPSTGEATLHSQSLFPASFTVSSISATSTLRASLPALPVGLYEYRLVLPPSAAAEYEIVYADSQQRIEVIRSITEPPVPQLTQAVFAKDGSFLSVLFSANTNKGGTSTSFTCSVLFDFSCAATSKCQWVDSATVRVYLQGTTSADSCAKPGSLLRLAGSALVKAKCQAANDNGNGNACPKYSEWQTIPITSLDISAPPSPLSPTVAISAPNVLGSCDSLSLDVSGSTGSGGRGWSNVSVGVLSTQGNDVSALSAHLRKIVALTPPPSIPANLLNKGSQYNFMVKLCNFLDQCSVGNKQVLMLNDTLPSVSLPGPGLRTVSRRDSLSLTSAAFVSTCDGKRSSAGLVYKWSIFSNNVQLLNTFSTSKDLSRYLLPAFSLAAGAFYHVHLTVSASGNAQSSSASVQVYVQPGSVVAVIKGGSVRTMRVGNTMSLDASASYDEDQSTTTGLLYGWSCVQVAPTYVSTCESIFDSSKMESSVYKAEFELLSLPSAAGAEGQVTVEVTDAAMQRSAKSSVTVSVLAALAPVVSVAAPSIAASGVINAGQALQLSGTLSVPANMGGNATWVVDDASIKLGTIALFPLTVTIPPVVGSSASAVSSRTMFMAFAGNSLPSGATLTFSLVGTIPYHGKQAVGSVSITVNAPPTPGSFYVSPDEGMELDKAFQFVALNWVDPDLPITYQFSYLSSEGLSVVVRSKLVLSFGSSLLPAGNEEAAQMITCVAQIFDSLSANNSATYGVKVTKNIQFNASQVQDFVRRSIADASADSDSIKQATALSSYLLNTFNCTLAPNCTSLHRKSCLSTAHTCGVCESLDYVGEEGDSNGACIPLPGDGERRLSLFQSYSAFADVSEGAKKPCPADCSGHGMCVHVLRDSGALITTDMPPCLEGLTGCLAVCDCDAEYFGSDSCEVPTGEFEQKQASRTQVIVGLQTLVSLENPDEQVIAGWVNGLSQAAQASAELSESAALTVLSLVDTITVSTRSLAAASSASTVSTEAVAGLLKAVNAVVHRTTKAAMRRKLSAQLHRTLQSTATDMVSPVITRDVLNNFGTLVASSMLPGQNATQFTQGEFRMSVQVVSSTADAAGESASTVPVTIPLTAMEQYLGHAASQVSIPRSASPSALSVIATSLRSEQFSSLGVDMLSNPLVLYSSARVCSSPPCYVDVVLQNSQPAGFDALNVNHDPEIHTAECMLGDSSAHYFTCKNGESLRIQCPGTASEVSRRCPVVSYSAACNSLNSDADSVLTGAISGCTVHSYTDDTVICRCDYFAQQPVAGQQSEQSRRALQSEGYNFSTPVGYSVSYVSMLQASTETFVATIKTADDLNASTVARGWRALATLGALAASIVVSLMWSHYSDRKAKQVTPITSEDGTGAPGRLTINSAGKNKSTKNLGGRKVRFNSRAKKALINAELSIVEDSLPRVLSSRTFSDRFMEEVKQHHRWFGIIFYFSDSFPRVLRVISLATNAIVMLFIQSITYNLTNPDDGSCELLHSEVDCLGPRSPFATGESKCGWVPADGSTTGADGSCVFIEPDKSIRIILFVAIFCAIVTTPIALAADWVVLNILSAPTEEPPVITNESLTTTTAAALPAPATGDALMTSLVPAPAKPPLLKRKSSAGSIANFLGIFNEEKLKEDKVLLATSRAELMMLSIKLKTYRDRLRADEVEEFNTLWGLDADGKFMVKAAEATTLWGRGKAMFVKKEDVNVKETVLMDLKNVNAAVQRESLEIAETKAPKYEIGKKLLFLFQCDLLPGISGKILELKGSRDTSKVKHVSLQAKVLGYTFLFLLDAGMLFYILLFALTQTGPRQNAWFQSFALWLVVEILLVSTAIVFITHILIPSLIMKDLSQIKRRLMDNIRDFNEKVQSDKENGTAPAIAKQTTEEVSFNAANFLFVSSRLAKQFPDLKESKIIAQFSTPWPRQSYLHVQNVSKKYSKKFAAFTRSASILLIFFVGNFLSVPPSIQDIVVQMTSTTAIGYIVLIHVQLFEIFPALAILPALSLLVLAHFIIQSSKADAKIKLARLFPACTKKNNKVTASPLDALAVDGKAFGKDDVHAVAAQEEACDCDGEEKSFDSSDESLGAMPVINTSHQAHQHKSRRQSIQTGLELLHAMKDGLHELRSKSSASDVSSSDNSHSAEESSDSASATGEGSGHSDSTAESEESDSQEDADSGEDESEGETGTSAGDIADEGQIDDSNDSQGLCSEDLHVAVGTPQSSPCVVRRKYSTDVVLVDQHSDDSESESETESNTSSIIQERFAEEENAVRYSSPVLGEGSHSSSSGGSSQLEDCDTEGSSSEQGDENDSSLEADVFYSQCIVSSPSLAVCESSNVRDFESTSTVSCSDIPSPHKTTPITAFTVDSTLHHLAISEHYSRQSAAGADADAAQLSPHPDDHSVAYIARHSHGADDISSSGEDSRGSDSGYDDSHCITAVDGVQLKDHSNSRESQRNRDAKSASDPALQDPGADGKGGHLGEEGGEDAGDSSDDSETDNPADESQDYNDYVDIDLLTDAAAEVSGETAHDSTVPASVDANAGAASALSQEQATQDRKATVTTTMNKTAVPPKSRATARTTTITRTTAATGGTRALTSSPARRVSSIGATAATATESKSKPAGPSRATIAKVAK